MPTQKIYNGTINALPKHLSISGVNEIKHSINACTSFYTFIWCGRQMPQTTQNGKVKYKN